MLQAIRIGSKIVSQSKMGEVKEAIIIQVCGLYNLHLWKAAMGLNRVQTRDEAKSEYMQECDWNNGAPYYPFSFAFSFQTQGSYSILPSVWHENTMDK